MSYCRDGWPDYISQTPGSVQPYWNNRAELTVQDGLLLKNSRIVIPSCMRLEILDKIHAGHQGIVKCRERAKSSVWWPSLSKQLEDIVRTCTICVQELSNHAEPLITTPLPDRPWQKVTADLCEYRGNKYLVVVDYFSRYVEVEKLGKTRSTDVINKMKTMFARHGIPECVRSDNGPQFSAPDFTQFSKDYAFTHTTSSPLYPQSNGAVERAVQTVKNIIKKNEDIAMGLLCYRTTTIHNESLV